MYPYKHKCTHTHTHVHTLAYTSYTRRSCTHTNTNAHTHVHTLAYTSYTSRSCTHTNANAHTRAHTHTYTHLHAHPTHAGHVLTQTHAHTHTRTHVHTLACSSYTRRSCTPTTHSGSDPTETYPCASTNGPTLCAGSSSTPPLSSDRGSSYGRCVRRCVVCAIITCVRSLEFKHPTLFFQSREFLWQVCAPVCFVCNYYMRAVAGVQAPHPFLPITGVLVAGVCALCVLCAINTCVSSLEFKHPTIFFRSRDFLWKVCALYAL